MRVDHIQYKLFCREKPIYVICYIQDMWKWKSISLKAPAGRTIYILYWEDNIYDNLARPLGSHCELKPFSLWPGCKQAKTRDGTGLVQ